MKNLIVFQVSFSFPISIPNVLCSETLDPLHSLHNFFSLHDHDKNEGEAEEESYENCNNIQTA